MWYSNNIIRYFCGQSNFILYGGDGYKWISRIKNGTLYCNQKYPQSTFHDLCHFIESPESVLLKPDFGLSSLKPSSLIRELNAEHVGKRLYDFMDRKDVHPPFNKPSITTLYTLIRQKGRETKMVKEFYPEIDEIIDRLQHNYRLAKFFS